ncbi:MAG TPA: cell division protein ZapA [Candidatus Cloacimonadota bacterium]|nr:cell division protein ZapA [Candidatus Cloacimonadota bacterium]HPK40400.1 cell division protein ZapA [Candidatus Cloacimonadota bacterium]
MEVVEIKVLGHTLPVKGDNAQKIKEYARYLDSYLREVSDTLGFVDQKTLFILAGLNFVETIYTLKEKNEMLEQELNKVNSLLQDL